MITVKSHTRKENKEQCFLTKNESVPERYIYMTKKNYNQYFKRKQENDGSCKIIKIRNRDLRNEYVGEKM